MCMISKFSESLMRSHLCKHNFPWLWRFVVTASWLLIYERKRDLLAPLYLDSLVPNTGCYVLNRYMWRRRCDVWGKGRRNCMCLDISDKDIAKQSASCQMQTFLGPALATHREYTEFLGRCSILWCFWVGKGVFGEPCPSVVSLLFLSHSFWQTYIVHLMTPGQISSNKHLFWLNPQLPPPP